MTPAAVAFLGLVLSGMPQHALLHPETGTIAPVGTI